MPTRLPASSGFRFLVVGRSGRFRPEPRDEERRVRAFGHPLPAVVHLPLGLLQIGLWTSVAGVILALPIAAVGLLDLLLATAGSARATAVQHMLWNLGAIAVFG